MKILLILLLIIVLVLLSNCLYESFENTDTNIELVIARYNEDLEWTTQEPFNKYKYIVYNKGNNEKFNKTNVKEIHTIKNVGRCDHTYLYHIIKNYDNLGNIVVFLPGSLDMTLKNMIGKYLLNNIEEKNKAIFLGLSNSNIKDSFNDFKMDEWKASYGPNSSENNESKLLLSPYRPFGKWFENYFGNIKVTAHCYYGIFSIDKRDIIKHPVSRYQHLIKDLETHSNPEVGHYFERGWAAVFYPMEHTEFKHYISF
jgi:hypothetical protein